MKTETPVTIHLSDYKAPDFKVHYLNLDFNINADKTIVVAEADYEATSADVNTLTLVGESQKLLSVKIDGKELSPANYIVTESDLTINNTPQRFVLTVEVEIDPVNNKSCEGLYKSGDIFCTQNEPQGFRKIVYFLDRSDVMTVYTTRIEAPKSEFPILLANGNKTDSGELADGRHFAVWNDPHKKPSYLFALVAGDLAFVEDHYVTTSGRNVLLQMFVDKGNEDRATYSLDCLKESMKWDEDVYGLEYDLDIYMIVAVDAFNMGAMENKGLNVFNSSCALANPKTATDATFQQVQSIIGHEYFHNWTGNRVTCRDWFQLTLKEGLTVFRDQEFSADMTDRPVCRIADVRGLRNGQFVEDGGPTAHPIKPASYIEINNFYTNTVYSKGAEVIRMVETFIGKEKFRKGMDKYFELYDGQAVTTEDFIHAMALASGFDFSQFESTWYAQAGTPNVDLTTSYDASAQTYSITVKQSCRPTPECANKKPYHFPLALGLVNSKGEDLELVLEATEQAISYLNITKAEETFTFVNISEAVTPSLLRDFSAPVKLNYDYTNEELAFLFANDTNSFNRYDAGQRLATVELERLISEESTEVNPAVVEAFAQVINDASLSDAFKAECLILPSETELVERMDVANYQVALTARKALVKAIAIVAETTFATVYKNSFNPETSYTSAPAEVGRRAWQNLALNYLLNLEKSEYTELALKQQKLASNMTDEMAAFSGLAQYKNEAREESVALFFKRWKDDSLVINRWFQVQASAKIEGLLEIVQELSTNPSFDGTNPNKIRSLYGAFAGNIVAFHAKDGSGYKYIADKTLEVDKFNPQIAGGLAKSFKKYAKIDSAQQALMKVELERILSTDDLSPDVFEIISKTLTVK